MFDFLRERLRQESDAHGPLRIAQERFYESGWHLRATPIRPSRQRLGALPAVYTEAAKRRDAWEGVRARFIARSVTRVFATSQTAAPMVAVAIVTVATVTGRLMRST